MSHNAPVRIVCAAIRDHDGKVYTVPQPGRHHHVIRLMADSGCATPITGEQGFVTSDGLFVDRRTARELAQSAGQLLATAYDLEQLFSEDIW